jgi:pimeloyl-ACP methyl ester carboxylesterase
MDSDHVLIHGNRVSYRRAGAGPALVLIHGMAGSSATWDALIPELSRSYDVLAPDLLGHGDSAKPRGDYSLGSLASGVRDLMIALGIDRATIVGHSLGGGVAMQFAYQFPERSERLVLVSAGGLGREVSGLLRALSLPGAEYILALACAPPFLDARTAVARWLGKLGLRPAPAAEDVMRSYASLGAAEARTAFLHTLRSVIDVGGQRVSALDRLYLAAEMPTLIVWGDRDPLIPVAHARSAHEAMPGSRLEIFSGAGHYPHRDHPARFLEVVGSFMGATRGAAIAPERLRAAIALPGLRAEGPVSTA